MGTGGGMLKKYNSTDEGGEGGAAAGVGAAVVNAPPPKPIRKPDPSLRKLQRQLSHDLVPHLGSLKRQKSKDAPGGKQFHEFLIFQRKNNIFSKDHTQVLDDMRVVVSIYFLTD